MLKIEQKINESESKSENSSYPYSKVDLFVKMTISLSMQLSVFKYSIPYFLSNNCIMSSQIYRFIFSCCQQLQD